MYQSKMPKIALVLVLLFNLLMPYNIRISMSMWRDGIFAMFVLLMCVFAFRIIFDIGKHKIFNYVLLSISCVGTCLFRANGFAAVIFLFVIMAVIYFVKIRKEGNQASKKLAKKIGITCLAALSVTLIIKFPVYSLCNVKQYAVVTPYSVPFQMLFKAITKYDDLNAQQREIINGFETVSNIKNKYQPGNSDPIIFKNKRTRMDYLNNNWQQLLGVFFAEGAKHPLTYITAFSDETRGYWNGGYKNIFLSEGIANNNFGIEGSVACQPVNKVFNAYSMAFMENDALALCRCIGFFTWICMYLLYVSVLKKNRASLFGVLLNLSIILSVVITTPINAEFRYAYCLFVCVPFLICATLYPVSKPTTESNKSGSKPATERKTPGSKTTTESNESGLKPTRKDK